MWNTDIGTGTGRTQVEKYCTNLLTIGIRETKRGEVTDGGWECLQRGGTARAVLDTPRVTPRARACRLPGVEWTCTNSFGSSLYSNWVIIEGVLQLRLVTQLP